MEDNWKTISDYNGCGEAPISERYFTQRHKEHGEKDGRIPRSLLLGSDWQIRTPFSAGFVNPPGASLQEQILGAGLKAVGFGNPVRSRF